MREKKHFNAFFISAHSLDFEFNFPKIDIRVKLQSLELLMGKMIGLYLGRGA